MTVDEARAILEGAEWTRETPLAALFDELVEKHDGEYVVHDETVSGRVTRALKGRRVFEGAGVLVATVLNLRRACGLPVYEVRGA